MCKGIGVMDRCYMIFEEDRADVSERMQQIEFVFFQFEMEEGLLEEIPVTDRCGNGPKPDNGESRFVFQELKFWFI